MINKKIFIFQIIIILIITIFIRVIIFNLDSNAGEELVRFNQEIEVLEQENIRYQKSIASASAVSTISQRAVKFGFDLNTRFITLTSPLPFAYKQILP